MGNRLKNLLILVLSSYITLSWAFKEKTGIKIPEPALKSNQTNICQKLDDYYKEYIELVDERIGKAEKNNPSRTDIPIPQKFGEAYIERYKYKRRPGKTRFVTLDIRSIAFFYKYMAENSKDSISFCFARYDKKALERGERDPHLEANPEKNKRSTLVVGDFDKKMFKPFSITYVDKNGKKQTKVFYDNWNDEWP